MQMFSCRFALPKHFWNYFFDYFCKYHDGRGLGKKLGLFDHLNYGKKTTTIYKREYKLIYWCRLQFWMFWKILKAEHVEHVDFKRFERGGGLKDRKKHVLTQFNICSHSGKRIIYVQTLGDSKKMLSLLDPGWSYVTKRFSNSGPWRLWRIFSKMRVPEFFS